MLDVILKRFEGPTKHARSTVADDFQTGAAFAGRERNGVEREPARHTLSEVEGSLQQASPQC